MVVDKRSFALLLLFLGCYLTAGVDPCYNRHQINAKCYGFDKDDSTQFLQQALNQLTYEVSFKRDCLKNFTSLGCCAQHGLSLDHQTVIFATK